MNEVVKALVGQFRDGGLVSPQLLVSSEDSEPSRNTEVELIEPHHLSVWSPIDDQHPVRGLLSFIYHLPYRCWTLRNIIRQHNVRVINPHYPNLGALLFLILKKLRLFKGRIILSFHGSDVCAALSARGPERSLWRMLLRGADHVVVVSDALGKDVHAIEPRVVGKMTTIYNGVDLAMFAPAENELPPRPSDPNQSKPTILSIASFTARKGHEVLVRAFARVLTTVPDACLVLVGADGPEAGATRKLVDQLLLGKKVSIFKDVPHADIPTFLSRARLFVLASRAEGNPLALIEAGAARLPVVFTRTPASNELITDGVTGRLVEVDDEDSLAQAITDLLVHAEVAQCMATKFHEHVRNNLNWKQTYEKYLKLAANSMSHNVPVAEGK